MKVRIDASRATAAYSQAFQRLRALEGFSQRQILRAEGGTILKTWAGNTPLADGNKSAARSRLAVLKRAGYYLTSADAKSGYVSITAGQRGPMGNAGNIWFRTKKNIPQAVGKISDGGTIKFLNRHFKDEDWAAITRGANYYAKEIPAALARGRASVGLARQSVVQIADKLGIDLAAVKGGGRLSASAIAQARAAVASNGTSYQNGVGSEGGNETAYFVDLLNRLPYNQKIKMDRELAFILQNRAKFIQQSYQKGAFDSLAKTAKAFPNVFGQINLPSPTLTLTE